MPAKINHRNAALTLTASATGDGRLFGRVTGEMLPEPLHFSDLGQLVLALDAMFDQRNFPQAFQRARRFSPAAAPLPASAPEADLPAGAETLTLSVLSRRSSSWQGFIRWQDGSRTEFSSTLVFIRVLSDHFGI